MALININSIADSTTKKIPLPTLDHVILLKSALTSYVQPEVGKCTLSFTRNFQASQYLSTGLYSDAAHLTAAYTYDPLYGRNRYKSTEGKSSLMGGDNRDLTAATWVKTNGTAAKNQVGIDGSSNVASSFTATSANATVLFAATAAATARVFSAFVKRVTGGGRVQMTTDGGTTWIEINPLLTYSRFSLSHSVLNPSVGFRLIDSGDAIAIDAVADENSAILLDPLILRGYDVDVSILTLGSLLPTIPNGKRYELSIRVRTRGAAQTVTVGSSAVNSIRILNTMGTGINVASYSSSSLQYNATAVNSGCLSAYPINQFDDVKLTLLWGLGKAQKLVNDVIQWTGDTVGKLDPGTMSQVIIDGGGEFSDLIIRELRGQTVCLVGDSIVADTSFTDMFYQKLNQLNYDVRARGTSGNIITDVTARVTTDITPTFNARASVNTVILWIGTNSLAANVSGATALTQLATCIAAIKAGAAWTRVLCVTLTPRAGGFTNGATTGSFATEAAVFNAGLIAAGADGVIDLTGVTEASDSTSQTYYDSFFIHPLAVLHNIMWPLFEKWLK